VLSQIRHTLARVRIDDHRATGHPQLDVIAARAIAVSASAAVAIAASWRRA